MSSLIFVKLFATALIILIISCVLFVQRLYTVEGLFPHSRQKQLSDRALTVYAVVIAASFAVALVSLLVLIWTL